MKKNSMYYRQFNFKNFGMILHYHLAIVSLIVVFLIACAQTKMSVEEAKEVTISIGGKLYVPPPRRIDDILTILDQPGKFDPELAKKAKLQVDAQPPQTNDTARLAHFYYDRGFAAFNYGRYNQYLKDIHTAADYAQKAKMDTFQKAKFIWRLGEAESWFGNYKQAIGYLKQSLEIFEMARTYFVLAKLYFMSGDFDSGNEAAETGIKLVNKWIASGKTDPYVVYWRYAIDALLANEYGRYAEAESNYRAMLKIDYDHRNRYVGLYLNRRFWIAENLLKQGRVVEAELEAREALTEALGLSGMASDTTLKLCMVLAKIKASQGQLLQAEQLVEAAIQYRKGSGLSDKSVSMALAYSMKGNILVKKYDFSGAVKQYEIAREFLPEYNYLYEKIYKRDPNFIISLIKTSRYEEAMSLISSAYKIVKDSFGEDHERTAILQGLRGMAYNDMNNRSQALKDFSTAVPILVKNRFYKYKTVKKIIIEDYIDLLTDIHGQKIEKEFKIDAPTEAFLLTDAIYKSSVQKALGASGARSAIRDSELAKLVRREQDTFQKVQAFEASITNLLSLPAGQQNQVAIHNLKANITTLRDARGVLLNEIKSRFPKYSDFANPQAASISSVQQHLHRTEALVLIWVGYNRTYVWAVPHKGKFRFAAVPVGKRAVQKLVHSLRKSLDPAALTLGDIPPFDLNLAYALFAKLLSPVEDGWKDASDLIVVATGPLGQLPLSILPTNPVKLGSETDELFGNYRTVPWLIRKVSITRHPSASAFVTQRKFPKETANRVFFAGFGDPLFNREQLAQAEKEKFKQKSVMPKQQNNIHLRGIRVSESGNLDSEKITTIHIDSLQRLPDTADEIKSIANALGADSNGNIFLRQQASERQVKTMNLSDRSIIVFATHALIPGDLDGLNQPALALSAPAVTGDNEDGLLKMEEILQLKLNADWVVLSACNTGAAQGAGAEFVSGLGRAFFYAGTKAILVSMWPVETTSARTLTTALFRYQKHEKTLSRARALRKSMLSLIDSPGYVDGRTGKVVASYAHPLFWAPFILVGDGDGHFR